jgi:hypothetical protein
MAIGIYLNTRCCDPSAIESIAAKLKEEGYEVETSNTLYFGAASLVKHATPYKTEASVVAEILKNLGWDIPVKEEPMIDSGNYGIIVFLMDTAGLTKFWVAEARRNVEKIEETARKMQQMRQMSLQEIIDKKAYDVLDDFNTHNESAWEALGMLLKIASLHLTQPSTCQSMERDAPCVIEGLHAMRDLSTRIIIALHVREMIHDMVLSLVQNRPPNRSLSNKS